MSDEECPYGNMPREAGAGHWRDWHRGHGCHLDPDAVRPSAPEPKPLTIEPQCPSCGANQTDHEGRCWWCNKRYRYSKVTP